MDPEGHTIRGARIALPELIQEFYARRGFGPAWSDPALANELRKALADSYHDGLDPADYHLPLLKQLAVEVDSPQATAELRAQNDILMTEGLLRLAYHLSFGKVDPESFDPQWNYGRTLAETDVIGEIDTAIASGRLYDRIEALKPTHPVYVALKRELVRYRAFEATGGWTPLPGGPTLKAGASDERVPELRRRLRRAKPLLISSSQGHARKSRFTSIPRQAEATKSPPASGITSSVWAWRSSSRSMLRVARFRRSVRRSVRPNRESSPPTTCSLAAPTKSSI